MSAAVPFKNLIESCLAGRNVTSWECKRAELLCAWRLRLFRGKTYVERMIPDILVAQAHHPDDLICAEVHLLADALEATETVENSTEVKR